MHSFLITDGEVITIINGKTYQADLTHPNYDHILGAIKEGAWDTIPNLMDRAAAIHAAGAGVVTVVDGEVLWNGTPIHNTLTKRILQMLNDGFNVDPMIKFMTNLMANPSKVAINETYSFLEACKLPITDDGFLIAYKRVCTDWVDLHSRTVCNKPAALMSQDEIAKFPVVTGQVTVRIVDGMTEVSMPREKVDDNRHQTCSSGLHFCSLSYLGEFHDGSGHIILLKINPADIVSIPADYGDTKGRCSKYIVLSEVMTDAGTLKSDIFNQAVVTTEAATNSQEFIEGYIFGYAQGKAKAEKFPPSVDQTARYAGYLEGYRDGRGHCKRKYSKVDLEVQD